jgi:predicted enzyme related to lactoylglutathione lyase
MHFPPLQERFFGQLVVAETRPGGPRKPVAWRRIVGGVTREEDLAMSSRPLLRSVDAVTVPVPDLDAGLAFYRDVLGHPLLWRQDRLGQAGLELATPGTELVLTTRAPYAPSWLVASADDAATAVVAAGGRRVAGPSDIPVGRLAVVADVFGNELVLVDLSKGHYVTDDHGTVTGVE